MTMAIFDFSAIRARMERREPNPVVGGCFTIPSNHSLAPQFRAAKGERVTITVQQGIPVEALVRSIGRAR